MMAASRIRVLLIEDNPDDAELIRVRLGRATETDFLLTHEDRLAKGIDRLKREPYDVVLLDFSLPDSLGLDTFLSVRQTAPRAPVIVLTSLDDDELAARAVREGAQDYLVKREVDTRLLVRSIRYAMARQTADDALRDSEERFALAVEGANDGLFDWDLRSDSIYFSPRWKKMLGYGETEIAPSPREWFDRIHPDDAPTFQRRLRSHLDGDSEHFRLEHRIRAAGGTWMWVLTRGLAVRGADGTPARMAGSQSDITPRKVAEAKLQHDALHDDLTGLANRVLFMDRLSCALADFERDRNHQFAVLFFDLDRFKNVNDSLGHLHGDRLLRMIAERVEKACRPGDTVARFGGDEFIILVEDIKDIRGATVAAERIQEEFKIPFELDGIEVFATISIGIALWNPEYERAEDLLRDSDTAMYRAKAMGRNSFTVFDDQMHKQVVATLRLENDLRRALARNEFRVFYQPIVAIQDGHIAGFEALVRWQHPERGLLMPADFIGVAEEMGAIIQIDRWVAEEACKQLRNWQQKFRAHSRATMSVNLSTTQLMRPDVVAGIDLILRNTGLYGQSLKLEVTESVLMENAQYASAVLEQLRSLNIAISIDDFGTGYSSFAYLRRFEIDTLKIDYSFVSRMIEDEESSEIVRTIITLAKNLGKDTVAEGVQTRSQFEALVELDVTMVQGYFIAPPLPKEVAESLLERTAEHPNHLAKILADRMQGSAVRPGAAG
jgi:diguanylate cyclase (GGDEF)-like protein/PAS domain S-box-containing protein